MRRRLFAALLAAAMVINGTFPSYATEGASFASSEDADGIVEKSTEDASEEEHIIDDSEDDSSEEDSGSENSVEESSAEDSIEEDIIEDVLPPVPMFNGYGLMGTNSLLRSGDEIVEYTFDMKYEQTSARTILDMVNSFRTGSEAWAWDSSDSEKVYYTGLQNLQYDYGLEKVAMQRAAEIAIYYAHQRPNGDICFSAYSVIGTCGENIAYGYPYFEAEAVFDAWREDNYHYNGQGHRRNMLESRFTYIGIGHVEINGYDYWVQEFNSVPTDLNYSSACDSAKPVTIEVDTSYITQKNLYSSYSQLKMEPEDEADLPDIYEKVATTESHPSTGQKLYGITPVWSGYDSTIISIDESRGVITALDEGETTLTATVDGMSRDISITVKDEPNISKVVVKKYENAEDAVADRNAAIYNSGAEIDIPYGQKMYLKGVGLPIIQDKPRFNPATNADVTQTDAFEYNSETGELTAKNVGSSDITFTSVRDNTKSATIAINVKEVPITEIGFDKSDFVMNISSENELVLTHLPEITSEIVENVVWSSSDNSILTVEGDDEKAVIRSSEKEGTAVIKAKMGNLTASVTVTVSRILKLDKKELEFVTKPGATDTLTARLAITDYTESNLIWTCSDPGVLEVDKGKLTVLVNVEDVTVVTVNVKTPDDLYSDTATIVLNPWARSKAPVSDLKTGNVSARSRMILSTKESAADIYYTIDYDSEDGISVPEFDEAGNPKAGTLLFDEAITVDRSMTVSAISRKNGYQDSKVVRFNYVVTYDWGDINTDKLKALFTDASEIPDGLWYTLGNETEGYCGYYTASGETSFAKCYTGSKLTFNNEVRVFHNNRRLWENRDYTVSYANNQKAAASSASKAPMVSIKGKGSYSGTVKLKFTVSTCDLGDALITSEQRITLLSGTGLSTIKPVVTCAGRKLAAGKDYDLLFYENTVSESNLIPAPARQKAVAGTDYIIEIVAHSNGNYSGKAAETVLIHTADSADKSIALMKKAKVTIPAQVYDPAGIDIKGLFAGGIAKVSYGNTTLTYGDNYEVIVAEAEGIEEDRACAAGSYNLTIRGKGRLEANIDYCGDKVATLKVTGIPASKVKVAGLAKTVNYTGKELSIEDLYQADKTGFGSVTLYTVVNGSNVPLVYDKNNPANNQYDIEISGRGEVGKLTVSFMLKKQFSGTIKKTVTVKGANLADATITAEEAVYSKAGSVPAVTVELGGRVLTEGIDYKLTCKNNTKISENGSRPTVTVTGIGNYRGSKSQNFTIRKALITEAAVLELDDKIYSPSGKNGNYKITPRLTDGGKQLAVGTDYVKFDPAKDFRYFYAETGTKISDYEIVPVGTVVEFKAYVTCPATSPYTEGTYELKGTYKVIESGTDIRKASVKVNTPSKLAFDNGKAIIPIKAEDLTVKMGKTVLSSLDYDIVSVSSNRFLGTATVILRGKGRYGGTKKFTFKISPRVMQ